MSWGTGDVRQRLEMVREDQREQVRIAENAISAELAALAAADKARAIARHAQDAIEADAREIDFLLDELPADEA